MPSTAGTAAACGRTGLESGDRPRGRLARKPREGTEPPTLRFEAWCGTWAKAGAERCFDPPRIGTSKGFRGPRSCSSDNSREWTQALRTRRRRRPARWQNKNTDDLEAFLADRGILDRREPLDLGAATRHAVEAVADDLRANIMSVDEVRALAHQLWSILPNSGQEGEPQDAGR